MEQCGENLGSPFVLWVKNVKLLEKVNLILMEILFKKGGSKGICTGGSGEQRRL